MSSEYLTGNDRCLKCSGHHPSGYDCMPKDVFGIKRMSIDHKDLVSRLRIIGPTLPNDKGFSTTVPQAVAIAADIIEALEREVAFVKGQLAGTNKNIAGWLQSRDDNLKRAEAAEAEVARLRGALEFYADENNWRDQPFLRMDHLGRECEDLGPAEIWGDNGERARKALEAK